MGYNIFIGNAIESHGVQDGELYADWEVPTITLPEAPNFRGDDMTGNSNARYPSYTQWANFCDRTGLKEVFFNEEDGLFRPHPGCRLLKATHLKKFKDALEELNKKDPRPAGLDERWIADDSIDLKPEEETHNYDKVRLIWLIFWTEWALTNCEYPAISNS